MTNKLIISLLTIVLMVACTQQPQEVRKLSEKQEVDSALMEQLAFSMRMADMADRECSQWVRQDSNTYAMDEFGFWYCKTKKTLNDRLENTNKSLIHIKIYELNGKQLLDTKDYYSIGEGDFPLVVNRCLRQMAYGEEMQIVTPWYIAYGAEGTTQIKPYSNLLIILTSIEE